MNIYVILAGEPGTGKTQILKDVEEFLRKKYGFRSTHRSDTMFQSFRPSERPPLAIEGQVDESDFEY